MINRNYASGQQQNSASQNNNDNNVLDSMSAPQNQSNINAVQSAVATLLGDSTEQRDRELIMNLVR